MTQPPQAPGIDPILLIKLLPGFLEQVYEAVRQTADEVVATGNAGSVSCSIRISRQENGDEHMLNLQSGVSRKPPSQTEKATWLFSYDGDLYRGDPRQVQLDFRAVEGQPQVRETDDPGRSIREISS